MNEESLFNEALAKPLAERAAFLEQACAGQPELGAAVAALLAAHERSGNVLDQPPGPGGQTMDSQPEPLLPGDPGEYTPDPAAKSSQVVTTNYQPPAEAGTLIAARYTLVEKIGEGGMGEVWVAKQTEPVKRKVALKLIKAGMDTRAVVQRFEQERQALALMDHPNIARVLDGGMTPDRRPFFVMELVNGLPLTRFCDNAKLGIRERLELFVAICQAVQHAHQKGIIHRDLKPSNILVTLIDARPVPKVIDFGVAKAIGGNLLDESLSTQFGAVIGTLEYMAPEQAGFSSTDIDTRADVYSLGVILYELLTGLRPIDGQRLRKAALSEVVRILQEEEPSKPSTRLSTDQSLPSLAALRQMEPKKLMALLRGELDWVVMKCLEKQRDRRYETANGLARDLQHYLADELVEARPPSAGYRLRKFARKHRAALASAAAIAVLLVAGLSVSLWQMSRAITAEGQAQQNARKARQERDAKNSALKAEQRARRDETKAREQAFAALRSMTDDVVEKKFAQGTTLTADDRAFLRGVIAQFDAFAAIKGDDADSQAMRAQGRLRVGAMHHRLGEFREAEKDYGQAQRICQKLVAHFPSCPDFRQGLALSHNNRGILLRDTGRPKEAEEDYDQALSIQKQLAADFPSRSEFRQHLAATYNNRGNLLHENGRLKEAEKDYGQALRIRKQLAADFPSRSQIRHELAASHNNRGNLLRATGRLKEAKEDYDQALSIQKQLAADFPSRPEFRHDLAKHHINQGILLHATGRLKEAEQGFDQALSIWKQLAADFPSRPEFRRELAKSHNIRGVLLLETGQLQEAEKEHGHALRIYKRLAADFPSRPEFRQELAWSHNSRADLLSHTRRLKEAEQDYGQALRIQKQLAADFPSRPEFRQGLASSYLNRGSLLGATGRLKETEKDYDHALSIFQQLAADFPNRPEFRHELAQSHNKRGILLYDTGRLQEAEKDYDQAVSIQKQLAADFPSRPEFRQELAASHDNRGNLLRATGRLKKAKEDYDQAVSIQKQLAADFPSRPEFRQGLAGTYNNRGILLRDTGRLPEAERDYDQALRIQKQLAADFPNQPDLRNGLAANCVNLAILHEQQGNWAAAKRLLLEGRPHHLDALKANPRHPAYRQFYRNHLMELTLVHAALLEQQDAVRTAQTRRYLGWNAPADAYDAACFLSRCLPIVAKHAKLDAKERKTAAQFYGGAAMKLLREAVRKGYKDVVQMKQDPDLDPLRRREDFQKFVAQLGGKGK
jgi:serine/threonine protein kinase/predicted RNA polymerase sigma factor